MSDILDVVIIGSGPAGLSAAVYAMRAQLKTLVIEKNPMSGGQIINTYEVDNYLGLPGINGFDMGMKMREHAEKLNTPFMTNEVIKVDMEDKIKILTCQDGTVIKTKTILIATGANNRKLGMKAETDLVGKGVSYCATCDGAFYRGKTVAVVGGGDVAVEDAIFLARGSKQVYLIHRRDSLRATKILQEELFALPNVTLVWDSAVEDIIGNETVEKIRLKNIKTSSVTELDVDGVFVAIGTNPVSDLLDGIVEMDNGKYIIANENCETSQKGIFAAGDIRAKQLRQVITAASDGANAITSIDRYLREYK
ncbi:thioredoxin-disulfide reductase [Anaeromicropila herbilytica]|uniref:Thioredoxin reductase n=1 Tax=Anaeromicropila herbilytica TaxID=2785025 RepID=A0A7R7EPL6_9FIRM|nr:thioredoxin-disulfide reductase [Anaeromicropila herbilytica]BCN32461.1 thioredoxin reductase [Anaeromicropila herbilytica]